MSEANKLTINQQLIYDVIIIGAGPAGLTASIYASRYKLSNLVIGKQIGGEFSLAHKVDNYPGYMEISGMELAEKWQKQAETLGAKVILKSVEKIKILGSSTTNSDPVFESHANKDSNVSQASGRDVINTKTLSNLLSSLPKSENVQLAPRKFAIIINDNEIYESRALIVATGSERRRLNIPGEKEYLGKGVSYCTTCDAPFFKGKTVALIGGNDSAVSGAVHTAEFASKVYLIYRGDSIRAEPIWQEEWKKIESSAKGTTIYNTNLTEILGDKSKVTGVKLNNPYNNSQTLKLDGVFIEIGGVPGTALVQNLGVKVDETGHVIVDENMATNITGLYCAGDMVSKSSKFKQAIWAMSQGAMAANNAYQFIKKTSAPAQRG